MTNDQIIKLAEHQGLMDYFDLDGDSVGQLMLYTIVSDAIRYEREQCARMVEELGIQGYGTLACAAAIRTREATQK